MYMNAIRTNRLALPKALLTFSLAATAAAPAHAILIDRGVHTQDTATDYFWLDVNQTTNISYNTMLGQINTGQAFDEYRYATEAEVIALFNSAGLPVGTFQTPLADPIINRLRSFQGLFGETSVSNISIYQRFTTNGLTSTNPAGSPGASVVPFIDTLVAPAGQQSLGGVGTSAQDRNTANNTGSWLILEVSPEGISESTAYQPTIVTGNTSQFTAADGLGSWYNAADPAGNATGFTYSVTDATSSFLTVGLPTSTADADQMFLVSDGINPDVVIAAGDFHTFDTPVSEFSITGIDTDVRGVTGAFPTFLILDQDTASFNIAAIPEPGSAIALLGLGALTLRRRRN